VVVDSSTGSFNVREAVDSLKHRHIYNNDSSIVNLAGGREMNEGQSFGDKVSEMLRLSDLKSSNRTQIEDKSPSQVLFGSFRDSQNNNSSLMLSMI
jgi:hypothetical protein